MRADRHQPLRTSLLARAQLVKRRTALVTFVRPEVEALDETRAELLVASLADETRALVPQALQLQELFPTGIQVTTTAMDEHDRRFERLSKSTVETPTGRIHVGWESE